MNILVHVPILDQNWGGTRQYSVGLIRILAQDMDNRYFIYHNSSDAEIIAVINDNKQLVQVKDADVCLSWIEQKRIRCKQILSFIARRLHFEIEIEFNSILDRLVDKYAIDIVHCPYQFTPITRKAKTIVTLHDVQEIHFPGFFTAEQRAYRAVNYLQYLREADMVIVSYNHVKTDLIEYFAVPATCIHVVLLNMDRLWFESLLHKQPVAIDRLKLPEKFLLYPANTWKHKNHIRLLQAIALLRDEQQCMVNLVCSGHMNEHYEAEIAPLLASAELQAQVSFIGVVDEPTLFSLYKHCIGIVVPTIYEAGSFPLVESILLGVPVVCSNITSLPETINDETMLFNPLDVADIAYKIEQLWTSNCFRQQSIESGAKARERLKHADALDKFLAVYITMCCPNKSEL